MNYIERYWRDATPADAIKEPPMVARFRQDAQSSWHFGHNQRLTGVDRDDDGTVIRWFSNKTSISFCHCQVYDAPDPGEGWRLIDTDKEKPQDGDEYYDSHDGWVLRSLPLSRWTGKDIYRRRITPAVTYMPFTWPERDQLRGRWFKFKPTGTAEVVVSKLHFNQKHGLMVNDYSASSLLSDAMFIDGTPFGKEVAQ